MVMIMAGQVLSLSIRRSFDKPRQMSTDRRFCCRILITKCICVDLRGKVRTDANTNANFTTSECEPASYFHGRLLNEDVCMYAALKLAMERDKIEFPVGFARVSVYRDSKNIRLSGNGLFFFCFLFLRSVRLIVSANTNEKRVVTFRNESFSARSFSLFSFLFYKNITLLYLYTGELQSQNTLPLSVIRNSKRVSGRWK